MRTHAVFAIAAGLLSAGALPAMADPAYKAIDIINHFAAPQKPTNLGTDRGLCIGTQAECGSPATGQATAAKPARPLEGFDLVVTFDHNSDVLTKKARENLDEFSKALAAPQLASRAFMIEGHTDATGTDAYNMSLSERRAAAVVRYLEEKGIGPDKLQSRGLGKSQPRTPNPFDAANRRVETRVRTE
jgi:OmpA-OmpF porin, OOP family